MPYTSITSRDNDRVKLACRIAGSAAARAENGLFFAEGARLCLDLAATVKPAAAFFTEKLLAAHPEAESLAEESYLVMPHVAEKLSETKSPQGLFCLFPLPTCRAADLAPDKGILVCENLQDPANVGAILRSAAAFGYGGVVLTPGSADPFAPKALRASAGAAARIPILQDIEVGEAAALLKEQGVSLLAAALEAAVPLQTLQPPARFALLIGNEGRGLTPEALALADNHVCIPMQGGVESLNAAVAASVLMFGLKEGGA